MSLTTDQVKSFTTTLSNFLVGPELNTMLESQGKIYDYNKKINQMRSASSAFNKEFSERHEGNSPYSQSKFAINQDILLIGFFISYAFLTFVGMVVIYKNTMSIQNAAYALVLGGSMMILACIFTLRIRLTK